MFSAHWSVSGVVVEARELTSKKNPDWRGHIAKVASLGHTFELQLNAEQFKGVHSGEQMLFKGRFEDQKGYLRLIVIEMGGLTDNGTTSEQEPKAGLPRASRRSA